MAWRLIVSAAALMFAGLAAPAEAQGVLYKGTLNLQVRTGDRVLDHCRSVIKLDPDDNVLDLAETVCLQPGPQGAGVSL